MGHSPDLLYLVYDLPLVANPGACVVVSGGVGAGSDGRRGDGDGLAIRLVCGLAVVACRAGAAWILLAARAVGDCAGDLFWCDNRSLAGRSGTGWFG